MNTTETNQANPYAGLVEPLYALQEELIDQADYFDIEAGRLLGDAGAIDRNGIKDVNMKTRFIRLREQADYLRYHAQIIESAAKICAGRGSAAELTPAPFVLPTGWTALPYSFMESWA